MSAMYRHVHCATMPDKSLKKTENGILARDILNREICPNEFFTCLSSLLH